VRRGVALDAVPDRLDEHGGIFDHVSPPTLPYGDTFRSPVAGFNFDRLGVRVGAIVVSPYVTRASRTHCSSTRRSRHRYATVHRPARRTPPYRREQYAPTLQQLLIDMAPRMERPDFGRPHGGVSVGRPRDPGFAVRVSYTGPPDVRTDATGVVAADPARPRRASAPGVPDAEGRVRVRSRRITTQRAVGQFMRTALAALHSELEGRDS